MTPLLDEAQVEVALVELQRYLKSWSDGDRAFLVGVGDGPARRYYPRPKGIGES